MTINSRNFTSLLFLVVLCFACNSEQTSEQQLTVTKISNNLWKKAKTKEKDKREGPHNFFALHHSLRTRTGEKAPRYAVNYKQQAFKKALKLNRTSGVGRKKLDWIERGPGNVGGRTRGLLVDARDTTHQTWLVGSAGGGIWKTTNGGDNWNLVTEELPNMATSTLASSAADPNIIYAGTGEGFDEQMIKGDGIYKSLDGGDSWEVLAATKNDARFNNVLRLVVDPADPNIVLAATRGDFRVQPDTTESSTVGQIMKSIDGGQTWRAVFGTMDDPSETFADAVQQIVADPTDFNVLYATVRDAYILKSIDKGENWSIVFDARETDIGRMEMAISPVDNQTAYFAAESLEGAVLYRTQDAGETWEEITGDFGNWFGGQGWYDNTIAVHPYDVNTVFVGGAGPILKITVNEGNVDLIELSGFTNRTVLNLYNPLELEPILTTEAFMLAAFGFAFTESPETLVDVEVRFGEGLTQKAHRHVFSASPFDTYEDYVDVPFEVWDVTNDRQLMVSFLDDDENGSWSINEIGPDDEEAFPEFISLHSLTYDTIPAANELVSFFNESYYLVSAGAEIGQTIDPADFADGKIFIETSISTGIGSTFEPVVDGYGEYTFQFASSSKGVHVDHHNILLIPDNAETDNFFILNANDGGVAFSRDAGATFVQTGDTFKEEFDGYGESTIFPTQAGYNTAQFYGVDKMNGGSRYVGGTQDNGSWVSPMDADASSAWAIAPSGDGFEAAWNYADPNLILESSQFNNIFRSEDGGETWNPVQVPGQGPFVTRIAASKQDPDLVFAVSSLGVQKSTDFGLSWTSTEMPEEWVFNGADNTVEVSLASPRVVWSAGSLNETERIAVSVDGGDSFSSTSGYDQALMGKVTGIGTHPLDKNIAYALFSVADGPKILKTTDLGQTWTDISGFVTNREESTNGFPDVATYSMVVMPFDTNQIWVGTEIGLFESLDGGATWAYADNGLPPVAIWEMKIVNDEVVLATHGRGIWSVSLPELAGYEPLAVLLGPQVEVNSNGFNGLIAGDANLRSAYDSTEIFVSVQVDEETIAFDNLTLDANDSAMVQPFQLTFELATDTIVEATVDIISYLDGEALSSQTKTLVYDVKETAVAAYVNNFDDGQSDFARLGFNIYTEDGFENPGLHSPHPYPGFNKEFITVLQQPIEVIAENALFTFDEVVLVEIGDSDEFGSPEFYDFVTIEGTSDNGLTWTTLDGYDSSRSPEWTMAYNNGEDGSPDLLQQHVVNLNEFYEVGDVVYLRFRLVSDPLAEGWGWMIDNIAYNEGSVSVEELPAEVALANHPNPFRESTVLQYTLSQNSVVNAALYSMDGKKISTILRATQGAGLHTYHVNTSSLESGIYFCRFNVDGKEQTLKWVKQ
ncbi:MAG: T9SS type A sorting domain-containing protein [Bacteroidota bacterium]